MLTKIINTFICLLLGSFFAVIAFANSEIAEKIECLESTEIVVLKEIGEG